MTTYREMTPEQKAKYKARVNQTHFRIHGQVFDRTILMGGGRSSAAARTLCDKWTKKSNTKKLSEGTVVECMNCMVIKDAWLDLEKRRPLTVRRWGALIDARFGGKAPNVQPPPPPRPTDEELLKRSMAKFEKEQQAHLAMLVANFNLREGQLRRLETRAKRTATAIKKAQRRLNLAQKKLELANASTSEAAP